MSGLLQDVRYALRQLRRRRRFAAVAVASLALGMGATTAIFRVVNIALWHTLPYRHPEQLVLMTETLPATSSNGIGVSASECVDYRDHKRSFSEITFGESAGFNLTGQGPTHRVNAAQISFSTFSLLGCRRNFDIAGTVKE